MKQRIYLSIPFANESINSKEMIESLAFAMMVKLTFVNSKIRKATVNRCKDIFGIGSTRMCQIIRNGIKYGYLSREGSTIIANSLKSEKSYHFHSDFEALTASRTKTDKNDEVQCKYKLKDIIALIREAVLLNHISKQSECSDTINISTRMNKYIAYTDGGCQNTSVYGEGGSAYLIIHKGEVVKTALKGFCGLLQTGWKCLP